MGLSTCWVALTFKKRYVRKLVEHGAKLVVVIAIGHGATKGSPHGSKKPEDVSSATNPPEWYARGIEAALLAPTAMNQQKFEFGLSEAGSDGKPVVTLASKGGPYSSVDLGIVRCHFELGAGAENFSWA
jgi:hypothetical protein